MLELLSVSSNAENLLEYLTPYRSMFLNKGYLQATLPEGFPFHLFDYKLCIRKGHSPSFVKLHVAVVKMLPKHCFLRWRPSWRPFTVYILRLLTFGKYIYLI